MTKTPWFTTMGVIRDVWGGLWSQNVDGLILIFV